MAKTSSPSFSKSLPEWILVTDEVRAIPSPGSAPSHAPHSCQCLRRWFVITVLFVLVCAECASMVGGGVEGHRVGVISEQSLLLTHISWEGILRK